MNILYGSIEIRPTYKVEGDKVWLGGYAIHRDMEGKETSRTENTWHLQMTQVPEYCLSLLRGERIS